MSTSETPTTESSTSASAPPDAEGRGPTPPQSTEPATAAAPQGEGHSDSEADADASSSAEPGTAEAGSGDAAAAGEKRKRRRRKRKRGGAGAHADGQATEGEGATAEGDAAGESGAGAQGAPAAGAKKGSRRGDGKRRGLGEGAPRERPAFHVGELVFGKILDLNEDAALIDLSGKGLALFDLREVAVEAQQLAQAPSPSADAATDPTAASPFGASATDAAEASAAETSAPTAPSSSASAAEAPVGSAVGSAVSAVEASTVDVPAAEASPTAEGEASSAIADGDDKDSEDKEKEDEAPQAPLPPIQLEVGGNFVGYVHNDGGRGGLVVVTRLPRRVRATKPVVSQAFKDKTLVQGLVTGVIKGGLDVDVDGLRAFAPASHVDLRPGADLTPLLARRFDFYVTQYGKRGRDVVLSRRPMLEAEAKAQRSTLLAKLAVGSVVKGTVRSVVQFGAFIDLGGIEGLVPLAEMSHNRSDGPSDVFKPGEEVDVKVLKIDDRGKIWLSRKAAQPDPWQEIAKKYPQGSKHTGKIVRVQPFGAFVELEPGIDGLLHVADISFKRIEKIDEVAKVGDSIDVVVHHLDTSAHRIALHPAPQGDAANEAPQRVQLHKPVKVVVVAAEAHGLSVRIRGVTGRMARGFVPSAATGTPRGTELRKSFPVGTELEAKVTEIDPRRSEIRLSIKALNEESERTAYHQYRAQVSKDTRFTFADLIAKKGVSPR
jgi:small subunit ribosomal protein S1